MTVAAKVKNKVLNSIDENELFRLTAEAVKIPSENPPGMEEEIATYFASEMRNLGLKSKLEVVQHGRLNAIGLLPGISKKISLLFNGHIDVVPAVKEEWSVDPYAAIVKDGKLYGRGSADMKAGLAAMLEAAAAIIRSEVELKEGLMIAATCDEEVGSMGAKNLVESLQTMGVKAVIIGEPTYNELVVAEKGTLWIRFITKGKSAHGAYPDLGVNAILKMVKIVDALKDIETFFSRYPERDLLGKPTINVGTISGGTKTNVVPSRCEMTVDIRLVPPLSSDEVLRMIMEKIKAVEASSPPLEYEVEIIQNRLPIETAINDPIVRTLTKIIGEVTKKKVIPKGVPYYTEASVFAPNLKVPNIIVGPGDPSQAHKANEHVELNKVVEACKIYALTALEILS